MNQPRHCAVVALAALLLLGCQHSGPSMQSGAAPDPCWHHTNTGFAFGEDGQLVVIDPPRDMLGVLPPRNSDGSWTVPVGSPHYRPVLDRILGYAPNFLATRWVEMRIYEDC